MKTGICLLVALVSMSAFMGVLGQPNPNCPGVPNDAPLIDAVPVLTKSVKHGQLYRIENGTNTMNIANVFGSPYQMGYAAGQLMPEWIQYNVDNMLVYGANYLFSKLESLSLPAFLIKIVKRMHPTKILSTLLEWNYIVTIPYTNKRWIEEMKGMSDASGVPLMSIVHMNLFPELTQAACSMVGAWGDATTGNVVRQLRALDWSPDAPVNKYPLITVYHSTEKGSNVFANIGFVGFIGSITAFSSKGIALAEKQWWTREKVPITYYGYPWMYVFRDLAQFSNNLSDAIDTIFHAKRTQKVFIGVGSLEDNSFLGVQYSEKIVNVFNDKNYTAYSAAHPQMDGILFWDKYVQPSDNSCLGSVLSEGYGNIDTEFLFRNVTGLHETGNAQICVFDFISKDIWLAYSYGDDQLAYQRSPMRIPLAPFFGSSFENPTVLVEA